MRKTARITAEVLHLMHSAHYVHLDGNCNIAIASLYYRLAHVLVAAHTSALSLPLILYFHSFVCLYCLGRVSTIVKPDNILVDQGEKLILCDFGTVMRFDPNKAFMPPVHGSVEFLPPEILM